jgi:RNA polymerase sigma factor (sigma-70 family)
MAPSAHRPSLLPGGPAGAATPARRAARPAPLDPGAPDRSSTALIERDRLERALDRLPLDQRAVIVLRYFADLPLDEVADILGIPIGTAKSRQFRGLEAMRDAMGGEPELRRIDARERAS